MSSRFFVNVFRSSTLANKLLQPKKYLVNNAMIKGFKLYNKIMSYFDNDILNLKKI